MDTRSEADKRIDRRVYPHGRVTNDQQQREQRKRDHQARARRNYELAIVESWTTTCALRDDVSGPALLGLPAPRTSIDDLVALWS